MNQRHPGPLRHALLALCLLASSAAIYAASDAVALKEKYVELGPKLVGNQFKRPLVLESTDASNTLKGDIYAVLDHPFGAVSSALTGPTHWCDVLILHLNTKQCIATTTASGTVIDVSIGKKSDQPVADAYQVAFAFKQGSATADYFDARLTAAKGPLGTSDYRIVLEAVPAPDNKTFIHLTYSYTFGLASKIAMKGYLATVGADKVGFTSEGKQADGKPEYIGGMRGVVERNTMRYYLAIDTFLDAPGSDQLDKRLQGWFAASEEYPRQLHEIERAEYIEMKHHEVQRQQAAK